MDTLLSTARALLATLIATLTTHAEGRRVLGTFTSGLRVMALTALQLALGEALVSAFCLLSLALLWLLRARHVARVVRARRAAFAPARTRRRPDPPQTLCL